MAGLQPDPLSITSDQFTPAIIGAELQWGMEDQSPTLVGEPTLEEGRQIGIALRQARQRAIRDGNVEEVAALHPGMWGHELNHLAGVQFSKGFSG